MLAVQVARHTRFHRSIFDDLFAVWIAKYLKSGAWLCRALLHDDMRAESLVLLCCLSAAGIGGSGRGPGSISGAGGFAGRLCCGCGRCGLVASIPGVREWSHAFALIALRAV